MASAQAPAEWELPFTSEEYAERLARVREEMQRRRIDLLYVTSPPNLYYLAGYRSVWFDGRNPTGLALALEPVPPILFDSWDHASAWPPTVRDSVTYGREQPYAIEGVEAIARGLQSRRLLGGRIGLERWSWAPAGPVLERLAARLGGPAEVVDGSFVVDRVRLIKSPREIEYTRRALAIADHAFGAVRQELRPGVSEKEIMGLLYHECARMGGDEPALRMMVHCGPHSHRFHAPATDRKIQPGEILMIDMCAAHHHYHGNTARAFSLGENAFWAEALEKIAAGLAKTTESICPGTPLAELQRRMDSHVDETGLREYVWWVGGYALGISMPPDWVGHVYLNPEEGFEPFEFVPGFVANWEIQVQDLRRNAGCGIIDTMIMTEHGLDFPARFPRALTVV